MNYLNKLKKEYGDARIFNRPPDMGGVEEAWPRVTDAVMEAIKSNREKYERNVLGIPQAFIDMDKGE